MKPAYRALLCLTLLHGVVDTYAMLVEPLWPKLARDFQLTPWSQWLVLTVAMVSLNFSQPVFGYLRDRFHLRSIMWLGPLIGVTFLPLIGVASHVGLLCGILAVGMIGTGSFHPEAVTVAGGMLPDHRTRGISAFLFGGTIGLGLGPLLGGFCVQAWGLNALLFLVVPGILLVLLLELGCRPGYSKIESNNRTAQQPLGQFLWQHGRQAGLLLIVATCRVLPAVGIPKAIAFTLAQQDYDSGLIGMTQSIFLSAGSLGMLWLAGKFQHGSERRHLILDPLVALPLMVGLALSHHSFGLTLALLAIAGLVLNGTSAAAISYSHQLFPQCTGIASSLTMGFAWGLSGLIVASLVTLTNTWKHPEWMYWMFLPPLVLSSLLATQLPYTHQKEL